MSLEQRRHIYTQERKNLVAANVMGQQRYLQTIRQQKRGYAAGQDADVRTEECEQRESESEQEAGDPMMAQAHGHIWLIACVRRSTML